MIDRADVVLIGDGPAGSALAQACVRLGIDVVLVGADVPWESTYAAWVDDLERIEVLRGVDVTATQEPSIVVWTRKRQVLDRPYATIDNAALRVGLRQGVEHVRATATAVRTSPRREVDVDTGGTIRARTVIDATGWPAAFAGETMGSSRPAWQTAFGVVLPAPPDGDLGTPTLMDFRTGSAARSPRSGSATFAYSLPVADGWLVEETVLAARPAVEPVALIPRMAARLGLDPDDMLDRAVRTEYVRIPMGGARPSRDQPVVAFGAAAGYINPISGFSVSHSMGMAPSVAAAIAATLDAGPNDPAPDPGPIWDAVWPAAAARTRALHDYGLSMLMGLDGPGLRDFFGSFFDLPTESWATYLRPDAPPRELAAVMRAIFRSASWPTRRRLVARNPALLGRLLRPR